jgi:hypothetical protein
VTVVPGPDPVALPARWREDVPRALALVAGVVLLGAPAGLLWSKVAPHLTLTFAQQGVPAAADLESTKAIIGADGSYAVVMLCFGLLTGVLAWFLARRGGPWTVAAVVVGGVLAALVAARVGVVPGTHESLEALQKGSVSTKVDLYLGGPLPKELLEHGGDDIPHLRAPWAAVAWPVGALLSVLLAAAVRPHELD